MKDWATRVALAAWIAASVLPCGAAASAGRARFGPAPDPERHVDWGGTPDVSLSDSLGLTVEEVEAILSRIGSADREERVEAAAELERAAAGSEQVLRRVLWGEHGAVNNRMRDAMGVARRMVANSGAKDTDAVLAALLEMNPNDAERGEGVRAATRVMSMLTALWRLDTMAGYKVMLDFSGRHAGVFRQEIGGLMVARGFDALPALIYGRGSKDAELHMFAVKWIRDMGDPLLGEQVRGIENPRRLAQLLEAYASVKELDAIDVTLSLAVHDSHFVRQAARACLAVYGLNAKWSVRRVFENTFSREPDEGTTVERWLDELYAHWDAERIEGVVAELELGLAHAKFGRYEAMQESFTKVLREEPLFERRHEMADGFLAMARALEEAGDLDAARAETLLAAQVASEGSAQADLARARLDWLEAESNRRGGALDEEFYRMVLAKDPAREEAARWAYAFSGEEGRFERNLHKAIIVSLFVFCAMILVYLRLRTTGRGKESDG